MRGIGIRGFLAVCCFLMLPQSGQTATLPDPKTGGANGGPMAVLFLSWKPSVFPFYADKLAARGFTHTTANVCEPLAPEFLKRFNVYVLDEAPASTYDYRVGTAEYRHNLARIAQNVEQGAGLLTYAAYDAGFLGGWNREMKRFGIAARHSGLWDESTGGVAPWTAFITNSYGWTRDLARRHPVTAGLKRLYYPMGELNGTAVYPTVPLEVDAAWTPLVKTMPSTRRTLFLPISGPLLPEADPPAAYTIAAAREFGKGRVGALSISPEFTHRGGYGTGQTRYELNLGSPNGLLLETGDGVTPSDGGELLMRLYAWLGARSAAAGFGGYAAGEPVVMREPIPPPPPPPEWPRFKALIGPRTAYSDGCGTVAEYARAARAAGYSLLVFAETFTALKAADWPRYAAECEANSDETLTVLPGFQIEDVEGSRFLYIAPPYFPRPVWLTADGARLLNPYTLNFFYTRHMVVVHRPDSSPIPIERLKHFQGLSVYTYRNGKLIDNSLGAFVWQVASASFPVPIVVHELESPAEVAKAAAAGFQQYLPEAETAADAVNRFCRQGFDNPTHPQIGAGPLIRDLERSVVSTLANLRGPAPDKAQRTFRVTVAAAASNALKTVTLYDGYTPVRRWRPGTPAFEASAVFPFSRQYAFWALAEDMAGRQAVRAAFWISPARTPGFFRCTDRQNWLGHVPMYYIGAGLPLADPYYGFRFAVKGVEEGAGVFRGLPGASLASKWHVPFLGNDAVVTDFVLDEKYVTGTFKEVGLAALPSRASKPTSLYVGRLRHISFTQSIDGEPWPAILEYDVTLKRAVEPVDAAGLFPDLDRIRGRLLCGWDEAGGFTTGEVGRAETLVPVPRGWLGGGVVPLDDGFAILKDRIGRTIPGRPDFLPAGTRLTGRLLVPGRSNQVGSYDRASRTFESDPHAWLRAMGFAGETPYTIVLSRGKMEPIAFLAPMSAENHGVAGRVERAAVIPYQVPLHVAGLNERWSAGLWREGEPLVYAGVFEGAAWIRLDVARPGRFYAGNLVMADRAEAILSLERWDANGIGLEAHNPTGEPMEVTISTADGVPGFKPFRRTVILAAGETVFLTE